MTVKRLAMKSDQSARFIEAAKLISSD